MFVLDGRTNSGKAHGVGYESLSGFCATLQGILFIYAGHHRTVVKCVNETEDGLNFSSDRLIQALKAHSATSVSYSSSYSFKDRAGLRKKSLLGLSSALLLKCDPTLPFDKNKELWTACTKYLAAFSSLGRSYSAFGFSLGRWWRLSRLLEVVKTPTTGQRAVRSVLRRMSFAHLL